MIIAHLSDLHLGYRAYDRTERGRNVRERDVAGSFQRAVEELIRIGPELVVVAGDVFDRPDPPPAALVALTRGFEALAAEVPDTSVMLVAGARDTPRRPGDPGALAALDAFPRVEAATGTARSIFLREASVHVCLVPYRASLREPFPVPEPDSRARWNVLVAHAGVADRRTRRGVPVDPDEWDYVALGSEHGVRRVAPRMHYSGALERVGVRPWLEAAAEKGFLTWDTEVRRSSFHAVPCRPVVALAPIHVRNGDPRTLGARIKEVTDEVPGGIDGKIVHVTLRGVDSPRLLKLQGEWLTSLRARALHLSMELEDARPTPRPTVQDLRGPVRRILEANGDDTPERVALLERLLPPDAPVVEGRATSIQRIEGRSDVLGRVRARLPGGLVAVVGRDGRSAAAFVRLLRQALLDPGNDPPGDTARVVVRGAGPGDGPSAKDRTVLRLGAGRGEDPAEVLEASSRALARARGGVLLDDARERVLRGRGGEEDDDGAFEARDDLEALRERIEELEGSPSRLREVERRVRGLRADHAEVVGDLEVATMEWLRERQDAETHLQAYRDRARELKVELTQLEEAGPEAPCPTCGRVLDDHFDDVVTELGEEWESVVQDGSWWKRRREQLEPKPEAVRELEGRSLRLQAATEECAERLERARTRDHELRRARDRLREMERLAGASGGGEEDGQPEDPAPALLRAMRGLNEEMVGQARTEILDAAGRLVLEISGGRVLGLARRDGGSVVLEGVGAPLRDPTPEDRATAVVAVRLGAARALLEGDGTSLGTVVVGAPFDRMEEEARLRAVGILARLRDRIPQILLVTRGPVVELCPEVFDAVLELGVEGEGGPSIRALAAGVGSVRLG